MVDEREKRTSNCIVDTGRSNTWPNNDGGANGGEGVPPSSDMQAAEVENAREKQDVGDEERDVADEEGKNDEHGDGVEGAMEEDDDTRGKPSSLQTLYRRFAFFYVA